MRRVLQLSDFHFGPNHGFAQLGDAQGRTLADVLARSLERAGQSTDFDALVLNGDLFTYNDGDERAKAEDGIKKIREIISADVLAAVPGNHDISWDDNASPDERLAWYERLIHRLDPALPPPSEYPHVIHIDGGGDEVGLALILLDSCRIESKVQAGLGLVGGHQLDLVRTRLIDAGVTPATHHLVAVLHHHLLPVAQPIELPVTRDPDASPRLVVSLTVDATDVLRELAAYGVSVVMHGHQHVHTLLSVSSSVWGDRLPLHIAAAGSCSTNEVGVRRHFQLWEFDDSAVTTYAFREDPNDRELFVVVDKRELILRLPS